MLAKLLLRSNLLQGKVTMQCILPSLSVLHFIITLPCSRLFLSSNFANTLLLAVSHASKGGTQELQLQQPAGQGD